MVTMQMSAVEAFSTTTKMAATDPIRFFWLLSAASPVTCFIAMIGCRPIQLRRGILVCAWW